MTASEFDVRISRLNLCNGVIIAPPQAGVTAVVGGNNVGKSTLLREASRRLSEHGQFPGVVVASVELQTGGTAADVAAWLDENFRAVNTHGQFGFPHPSNTAQILPKDFIESAWYATSVQPGNVLGPLAQFLLYYGDAHSRIANSNPAGKRENIGDPPQAPLHHLESNKELLDRVRSIFQAIFREDLTLDRLSGNLQLRVGKTNVTAPSIEDVTTEYVEELAALGSLSEQGDGMRSLMGIILPLMTGQQRIVFLDEPEAFLHPPQARKLGAIIGQLSAERSIQVLVATHDRNLLLGLLESTAKVSVVRLDRDGRNTSTAELPADRVRDLWESAVLRYSNVLEGLFHRAVVLAEGDRDCRFYEASIDSVARSLAVTSSSFDLGTELAARSESAASEGWQYSFAPGDLLFVPANGKDGFPALIEALNAISVPVVAVPDLDALNEESKFKLMLSAIGVDWRSVKDDYRLVVSELRTKEGPRTCGEVLAQVENLLGERRAQPFNRQNEDLLRLAIRRINPWQEVKEHGANAFSGARRQALERLDAILLASSVALVWEGQLESLGRSVESKKGPGWLREAIDKEVYAHTPAVQQAHRICSAIEARLTQRVR